jgi:hypothetical protein
LSALTKVFVVLHVVLTMLFVGATVVFVNQIESFSATGEKKDNEIKRLQGQAEFERGRAQTAIAEATSVKIQAGNEVSRIRQLLNTELTNVRERDTQIATLRQSLGSAEASLQGANAALATAQESNKLLQGQINETRTASDKIQEENTQLQTAIADITARHQTASRALQNANEEIEELRTQLASFQDRGGPAGAGGAGVASAAEEEPGITPANPINGVIRDKRNVNGVNYATISVGSQDQVTENMIFNVIDRGTGDFLGYVRIDRVEPNEAVGRLDGPRVADMKPGNEVRTQL